MDFKFIKHTIYNGKRYLKGDTVQLSKNEAEDLAERGFGEIIIDDNNNAENGTPDGDTAPDGDNTTPEKAPETKTKKDRKAASGK